VEFSQAAELAGHVAHELDEARVLLHQVQVAAEADPVDRHAQQRAPDVAPVAAAFLRRIAPGQEAGGPVHAVGKK
jgi:hypothetical protein